MVMDNENLPTQHEVERTESAYYCIKWAVVIAAVWAAGILAAQWIGLI